MVRPSKEKQYLYDERKRIIFQCIARGFSQSDTAFIVNVDPSAVSHLLDYAADEYEDFLKKLKQ